MSEHERVQELLAVEALGGLDENGRRELDLVLAEHGYCPECAATAADFAEAAGRFALALEPSPTSMTAADVLAAAKAPAATSPATGEVIRIGDAPRRRRGAALVAAAIAAAIVVGGIGGALLARHAEGQSTALARYLTQPQTQIRVFNGSQGTLQVATQPGTSRSYVFGNLGSAPAGKVYQLWTIRGSTPVAGPTFVPKAGSVVVQVDTSLGGASAMAITVEPVGGSDQPTGKPILVAPLSI